MAIRKYPENKSISIPIQKLNIRKVFKSILIKEYYGRKLKMILRIQPSEISKVYNVLIIYESIQKRPQVYVSIDQLEIEDKNKIPHNYGIKNIREKEYVNLCLYYKNEWNSTMKITETIIPWISEWLYHFEFWSITGKWCGGGKHPTLKDKKINSSN